MARIGEIVDKTREKSGEEKMKKWKRRLITIAVILALLCGTLLALALVFENFVVDLFWFRSLHYEGYFWLRLMYKYLVFLSATLLFFMIFFLNFWVASRYLGTAVPSSIREKNQKKKSVKSYREMVRMFRTGSMKLYTPFSLVLAIIVAFPLFEKWETALFYVFGSKAGIPDTVFGTDISYYFFSLPIYVILEHRLLVAFSVLFAGILLLYLLEHRFLTGESRHLPKGAKVHLSILLFFIVVIKSWDYLIQRSMLVYSTNHMPLFAGPGFIEHWVTLPLIWACLLAFIAVAAACAYRIHTQKGTKTVAGTLAIFVLLSLLKNSPYLPGKAEKYLVKPNEITREKAYIKSSIDATLAAYNLNRVKIQQYHTQRIPWTVTPNVKHIIHNIPVWDRDILDKVYTQLQAIRPYYTFGKIDVGRYTVSNVYQQVYLSAREIQTDKLPDYAQNWVNLHLQYTHGNGVVMTPAAQGGDEFMTWFIQDIPPTSRYGFKIDQPRIYYGTLNYPYVICPSSTGEFDYPKGQANAISNYDGTGGVHLSSMFCKLIFSIYFKDKNIFFTTKTTAKSRILLRRNIQQRIRRITPFFLLDSDPYVVVTSKRLYWLQDAFTTSAWYPDSENYTPNINYIRDSVKILVDAYNGNITYYVSDKTDPIIRAYQRMYPGLLKPLEAMPKEIRKHIRYPKDFFKIQMVMYGKYHQADPELFYRQEDIWDFARINRNKKTLVVRPYYLTLNLFDPHKPEFLLLCPMTPINRDNMRALVIGRCDGKHYGELVVYSFPTEEQVYGPSQIEALINQDTNIAKQITLWDQAGSEVIRGRMIIIPVDKAILYIEPLYLKATSRSPIPELKRLIVSQGDVVAMERTLEEAFKQLEISLKARTREMLQRYPLPVPEKPIPAKTGTKMGQSQ